MTDPTAAEIPASAVHLDPGNTLRVDSQEAVNRSAALLIARGGNTGAYRRALVERARQRGLVVPLPAFSAELYAYLDSTRGWPAGESRMNPDVLAAVAARPGGKERLAAMGGVFGWPTLAGTIEDRPPQTHPRPPFGAAWAG